MIKPIFQKRAMHTRTFGVGVSRKINGDVRGILEIFHADVRKLAAFS
jgi:hypothetical protein